MQGLNPINYRIHLEPDLVRFKFDGHCEILLESATPAAEVVLNILEIAVWGCRVLKDGTSVPCSFSVVPAREEIRISLPEPMSGNIHLDIDYQGMINDKMAGFYRSKFTSGESSGYIAVTQFQESDARRAFPCLDHPAKKATFDIQIDIDQDVTAISNSDIEKEILLENGKKQVVFAQTPKMSTYLVFFGVGKFEFSRDEIDHRVRVATLPGMKAHAKFGAEFGRKSLEFSESYYAIPYPLPKMDLIAIPDFAFGAMENWGAITFRENLLLHYPEITSKSGEERICEVIAHEIAHQWFGNLVTPSDWKYLWLNESFATYFGFGVVDHYYPEWAVWQQFLHQQTGSALVRDALHETVAIEIPGGEHVVINAGTAPIIYSKGGSILRQIEGYIGADNFKAGLRHYLKTYEYGCAASHDLWLSFEAVTGQPISAMMKSWIEQMGFPVITVSRRGSRLVLSQRKFTYLPNQSDEKWMIPISISLFSNSGTTHRVTTRLDDEEQVMEIPEDTVAYKINDGQTGFYRVRYHDPENLAQLGKRVREKSLPPEDRWGLESDFFARVRAGEISLENYLDFIFWYREEDACLPLTGMAGNLYTAYLVMDDGWRRKISALAKPLYEDILEHIGYHPAPDENHPTALMRDRLLWDAALFGSEPVLAFARDQFARLMNGGAVHADIMKSIVCVAALCGDERTFEWFQERLQQSHVEHERLNILSALGCFRDEALLKRAQQYTLDAVPARNQFIPVVAMAANPHATSLLWNWYVDNLEKIEQFHPMLYERVIAAVVPIGGMAKSTEVRAFYDNYMKKTDKAKDVIKLSLERLEINLRMRAAV